MKVCIMHCYYDSSDADTFIMTETHNSDGNAIIHRVDPIIMSTSPDQLSDQKNKELASLFECPVCFDSAIPPILQCQSGHIVCSACRSKLTACPTCRGPLALEKLALNVLFPCKYASCGCQIFLQFTKKKQHEEVCDYRPYLCPCPDSSCKWMGRLDEIMTHLIHSHKNITTLQGEDIVFLATDINLPGAVDWVMMQTCFGFSFMLVLEKQERLNDQRFYAIVRLIGTRKQAQQFAYRLELSSLRRRLTWDATPCSIHDSVQTAISNSDCLVLDASTAHIFAKNGNLGINVTIWPVNYNSVRRVDKLDSTMNNSDSMGDVVLVGGSGGGSEQWQHPRLSSAPNLSPSPHSHQGELKQSAKAKPQPPSCEPVAGSSTISPHQNTPHLQHVAHQASVTSLQATATRMMEGPAEQMECAPPLANAETITLDASPPPPQANDSSIVPMSRVDASPAGLDHGGV